MGVYWSSYREPERFPDITKPPTFDPMFGFPNGRKPREMIASQEEMVAAKLELDERDYCAHKLIDFRKCRSENWPWVANCKHEKHEYLTCQFDDYVLRMKEYEREKRLKARQHRIEAKTKSIELAE
ncbi:NADH dehydrogenase [ubiquinone] 1 beta subcomplex subunit 7 [Neocloeon triangulifer]|uniref:NADH dehydrogenase [ubiquinone] 1 beta subcomplex subunit 7 n=1 Tax=Neocloeon triangulifer TaxID=2078957 RepID=UPI00286F534C|nr:NADH dehydrogenase [ubiquinone] 1 beta subcomplex subunit 7 [Neocloeon triangulifer]